MTRKQVFILVAMTMTLPFFFKFKIGKMVPSTSTENYFTMIEKLPEGSIVLASFDFGPDSKPEIAPVAYATLDHLFKKNVKVVAMTLWETGQLIAQEILKEVSTKHNKIEGKDWCFLGFRTGKHSVVLGMGKNIYSQFSIDCNGNKAQDLEIMKGLNALKDFPLVINFSAGDPGIDTWVLMGADKIGLNLIGCCTAVMEPSYQPYLRSGQLKGLAGGMRGAGEYEELLGITGKGTKGMNTIQLGMLLIVVLIILGNVIKRKHG